MLNFDKTNTKITYEMVNKLREEYTQEEKALLQKVDEIENKLLKIRGVEGDSLG
ncbi:hypothetical protein IJU97_06330 [bacterium]|nr:hypothetical protein [bacterium]